MQKQRVQYLAKKSKMVVDIRQEEEQKPDKELLVRKEI